MKATYINRYKDQIVFEDLDDCTVRMTGYGPYFRVGYENEYEDAYDQYLHDCQGLTEPDLELLYEDVEANKLRTYTFDEFKKSVFDIRSALYRYRKAVKSSPSLDMIDPSGGPFIPKGFDLGMFFEDRKKRIITKIENKTNETIFTIKTT